MFAKFVILIYLAKFADFNFKSNISTVNLLNSGVVIYWSYLWSVIFFSISLILVLSSAFSAKLLTLGILFLTAVWALVVAKLVMLGISPLTLFILALTVVLVAKLIISGILSSIYLS